MEKELLDVLNRFRAIHGYPRLPKGPNPPYCSFCGRSKEETEALVAGMDAYICGDCANEARRLLIREEEK